MGDRPPHPPGLCPCQECQQGTVPGAKRSWDSSGQAQHLPPPKKICVLSHVCSTPNPSENLLLHPSPSACPRLLEDSGYQHLRGGFPTPRYDDVNISLDTSRCFEDSELDDSLLELSGSEKGNSPSNYTEEEIQRILADDCMETEQPLSPNANGESWEAQSSSSCSEGTSGIAQEPVLQGCSPGSSGGNPGFLGGREVWDGLLPEQDMELQELLALSPFPVAGSSECPGDDSPVEMEREDLDAMIDDCLRCVTAAGGCVPKESSEAEGRAMRSDLTCEQSDGDKSSASGAGNKDLPTTTQSWVSWNSDSPEDEERESPGAEQPSGSIELSATAGGQTGQEETTSGEKPGEAFPAPQDEEERLKERTYISEVELGQEEHLYPECAQPYDEEWDFYISELLCPTRICLGEPPSPTPTQSHGFYKNSSKYPFWNYLSFFFYDKKSFLWVNKS